MKNNPLNKYYYTIYLMSSLASANIITKTQLFGSGAVLGIASIIYDTNQKKWSDMGEDSKITRLMGYGITSQFLAGTILSSLKKI